MFLCSLRWPPYRVARTAAVLALLAAGTAGANVYNAGPSTYSALVSTLKPGDTLQLATGTYTQGLVLTSLNGAAGSPITIQGPADQSAVFLAQACCNTVEIASSSFIVVRNLTLDGQHLDGPFGVNSSAVSHDITIENLLIINHDGSQQCDGISTKSSVWNWVVRHNTIIGAGTGMYFGNSDGSFPFVAGLIEDNLVLDTIGYNIEIKQQLPRPTNLGLPTTDSRTIIRHNTFSKQNNGSSGGMARPNLLVGGFPSSGPGVNDLYEIYGNFFYENPNEALFQGEGNVAFYDNVLVADTGDAIHFQYNTAPVQNVTILNNTILAMGNGITVTGVASGYVQKIVGNAVFAGAPISGPGQAQNVTDTYASASNYVNAPFAPIGALDLYPKSGQLAGTKIDLTAFASLDDAGVDFNAAVRDGVVRGAYTGQGVNPGWQLARAIQGTAGTSAPQVTLSANPLQVSTNGTTVLQWTATNATACTASGGWTGSQPTSGSATSAPLTASTLFTLTCTGSGGSASQSVTVTVASSPAPPTVSLTASPTSVSSGGTTTLSWSSTNATACTASGAWSGAQPTSGTHASGPLSSDSTFTLTCTGTGGTAALSATVTVAANTPAPTVTLTASPTSVAAGGMTTLSWNSTDATGCTASGGWSGTRPTSGSESSAALQAATTFTLSCTGAGGSAAQSASVSVTAAPTVKSGGGGAMQPLALAALGLVPLLRRQRRRRAADNVAILS